MGRVVHRDSHIITRIHEQVCCWIRRVCGERGINGIDWCMWYTTLGDEGKIDGLNTYCRETGRVIDLPCHRILRKAVDVERCTPLGGRTTHSSWPRGPT